MQFLRRRLSDGNFLAGGAAGGKPPPSGPAPTLLLVIGHPVTDWVQLFSGKSVHGDVELRVEQGPLQQRNHDGNNCSHGRNQPCNQEKSPGSCPLSAPELMSMRPHSEEDQGHKAFSEGITGWFQPLQRGENPQCDQSHRLRWTVPTDRHGNKTRFESIPKAQPGK